MNASEIKNTRKHPRHEAVFKISYQDVHQLVDYTENLSEGGVFIATEKQFEPGSEIAFELSFPGLVKPIRLTGEVIWRRPPESLDEVRPPGIGVRLKFGTEIERTWLRDLLQKLTGAESDPGGKDEASTDRPTDFVILLAEDNEVSRAMFQRALTDSGQTSAVKLEIAESDSQASTRAVLARQRIDLMIIEWRMCTDGQTNLLEEIRTTPEWHAPTVLVLGATEEEGKTAMATGAHAFLRRPVPAKGLIRTVQSLLNQKIRVQQP